MKKLFLREMGIKPLNPVECDHIQDEKNEEGTAE
jgi:hypothetical protein